MPSTQCPQPSLPRRILYIDMDAFFASVEVVRNPALRGKPVIVGGKPEGQRGVVSTASYEARGYGIRSGMSLQEARRLCPQGIFLVGDFPYYQKVSERLFSLLQEVSPKVQMASVDEAYVDITGSLRLFGGEDAIAYHLKRRIREQLGLPCSIGIASTRVLAKIASGEAKPDGYVRVEPGRERAFLEPLPIGVVPGVGPHVRGVLEALGVHTLGRLASYPLAVLEAAVGRATAEWLWWFASGGTSDVWRERELPKSISRETTFAEDLLDWPRIEAVLSSLTERCVYALREAGLEAQGVGLKVRYADFETHCFRKALPEPTALDGEIHALVQSLLPQAKRRRARIRLIGVVLFRLQRSRYQPNLFQNPSALKWERVLTHMDAMRRRLGFHSIHFARSLPPACIAKEG